MTNSPPKPMSWPVIIGIMVGVGLLTGLLIGGVSTAMGWSPRGTAPAVGAAMGVTGALLMTRRKALMEARAKRDEPEHKP